LSKRYSVQQGSEAFAELKDPSVYTCLIEYGTEDTPLTPRPQPVPVSGAGRDRYGDLSIGCIGAGGFARTFIFPRLRDAVGVLRHSVATATGVSAASACKVFGFARAQTPADLLSDPAIQA